MLSRLVFFVCMSCLHVEGTFLTKKICKDVDTSQCNVYNVVMDPCPEGPSFCTIKRNKRYTFTVDFTPNFSADSMNMSMYADDSNSGVFDKVIKTPESVCDVMTCPVDADTRRIFDVDFSIDKTVAVSKFPVKVKMWSSDDESKVCCFTFNVKIQK